MPRTYDSLFICSSERHLSAQMDERPPPDSMCALIKKRAPRREASCAYRELLSVMR